MIKSSKGKTRLTMIGNRNGVKEVVKTNKVQVRINEEDKLKLIKFCKDNDITQTDFLINSMVDQGILPESRRSLKGKEHD